MVINEFEIQKQEKLAPVYWEAGVALMECQTFEYGMKLLLHYFARIGLIEMSVTQCEMILENESKKTLGQLIKVLRDNPGVKDDFKDKLSVALGARNTLIHRILIDNMGNLDSEKINELVAKIRTLRSKVREGDQAILSVIHKLGIALDDFDGMAYMKCQDEIHQI